MARNEKSIKGTALLTAAVLATSCFVGGTIARYITTTMSEDSARVAVWGINADDVEMNLFASEYDANGNRVAKSWNGEKIIAPGTSMSSLFSIVNLDGTLAPEVMYEIKVDVDDTEIDQRILDNPSIQWKLDDNAYGTWADCKADILALSGDASGIKTYQALEVAEEFADGKTHTIYWRWMLDDNHTQDTAMGNKAAYEDIVAKINVKVTARQVQEETTGILNGTSQSFNMTAPAPLTFRSAAPLAELQSVKVGDVELARDIDYTATEGSTVITLKENFLNTLTVGSHKLSIVSLNGTATVTFKVVNGEAEVAGESFPSLQDAIELAEGAKVKLLKDVTIDSVIDINENSIIDLNGYKLTLSRPENYAIIVRGHLTIEDTSEAKTGEIYVADKYGIALSTTCTGGLTVNSGKFTAADTSFYTIGAYAGKVEINGGDFSSPYCVVNSFDRYTATVEINAGTFKLINPERPEAAPLLGINFSVKGGTFSHPVLPEYCAAGYTPFDNGDGTYTVKAE